MFFIICRYLIADIFLRLISYFLVLISFSVSVVSSHDNSVVIINIALVLVIMSILAFLGLLLLLVVFIS